MKTSLALIALSLLAGSAVAQTAAPANPTAPAPAAAQPAAAEPRKPLVLRLDEIDGPRMTFGASPDEKLPPKDLPSLGGDARALPAPRAGGPNSPFPRDAEKATQDTY